MSGVSVMKDWLSVCFLHDGSCVSCLCTGNFGKGRLVLMWGFFIFFMYLLKISPDEGIFKNIFHISVEDFSP